MHRDLVRVLKKLGQKQAAQTQTLPSWTHKDMLQGEPSPPALEVSKFYLLP